MYENRAGISAAFGHHGDRVGVDYARLLAFRFAFIDIGYGGAIYDNIESGLPQESIEGVEIIEIEWQKRGRLKIFELNRISTYGRDNKSAIEPGQNMGRRQPALTGNEDFPNIDHLSSWRPFEPSLYTRKSQSR
jgi:hypothetical protein